MAKQVLVAGWCLLVFCHVTAASLNIGASPNAISPGLTTSLAVNCTFSYNGQTNVSSILSMIISKLDPQNNQTHLELVSVNAFSGDNVNILSPVSANTIGHIGTGEDSYLSIVWIQPTATEAGLYLCEASLMDTTGHPLQVSASVQVTSQAADLALLTNIVTALQTDFLNQKTQLTQTIAALQAQSQHQWQILLNLLSDSFEVSTEYNNGHYYLLSKADWDDAALAEDVCERYGAYLVEIDDAQEYAFVKSFVDKFRDVSIVLVGATDEANEGLWVFRYSQKPVVFTAWFASEPDEPSNDCMYIYRSSLWQMRDYPCVRSFAGQKFLCEVETKYI